MKNRNLISMIFAVIIGAPLCYCGQWNYSGRTTSYAGSCETLQGVLEYAPSETAIQWLDAMERL